MEKFEGFFLFKDLALYNEEFNNSKKKKKLVLYFFTKYIFLLGLKHVSNVCIIFLLLLNEMMLSTVP